MRHRYSPSIIVGIIALSLAASTLAKPADEPVAAGAMEAIWRTHQFNFHFRAIKGSYHSCSSLQKKISGIMQAVGAARVMVKMGCNLHDLTDDTFAHVMAAMPQEATVENVRAATTFDSRQELLARVRKIDLPTENDIARFPAEWRTVSVAAVRGLRLGSQDCELLDNLSEQVFPHLSVRILRERLTCSSALVRPPRPVLVVEALMRREA